MAAGARNIHPFFFGKKKKKKKKEKSQDDENFSVVESTTPATHLTLSIEKNLASADIAALLFFAGILLAVGALDHIGLLDKASHFLLGEDPGLWRLFGGIGIL